jgi:hypothetical protein
VATLYLVGELCNAFHARGGPSPKSTLAGWGGGGSTRRGLGDRESGGHRRSSKAKAGNPSSRDVCAFPINWGWFLARATAASPVPGSAIDLGRRHHVRHLYFRKLRKRPLLFATVFWSFGKPWPSEDRAASTCTFLPIGAPTRVSGRCFRQFFTLLILNPEAVFPTPGFVRLHWGGKRLSATTFGRWSRPAGVFAVGASAQAAQGEPANSRVQR